MDEAAGSIPASSTPGPSELVDRAGFFLGGYVAGEGCFTSSAVRPPYRDGSERRRFVFAVSVAACDLEVLRALHELVGGGSLRVRPPRRDGWQPTATFAVSSNRMHLRTTLPFADRYLLPSAKRDQYLCWRAELLAHLEAHPSRWGRGPSTCRVPGCDRPVRGRGLCRSHYYRATGW
jgi:hypothetical protein